MLLQVLVEFTIWAACLLDLLQVLLEQAGREIGGQRINLEINKLRTHRFSIVNISMTVSNLSFPSVVVVFGAFLGVSSRNRIVFTPSPWIDS